MTELMYCARSAATRAYCPHSKFHVGAAVRISDGRIFEGCNVENASFGLTICAERCAIFKAVSAATGTVGLMKPSIIEVAISCPDLPDGFNPEYSMPCGACRQVLAEFASPDCVVDIDRVGRFEASQLLPNPFKL